MIDFTREAQLEFDQYMARIGRALRGRRDRTELEQNVREHVEAALAGASAPIGTGDLTAVLANLGPPEMWIPEDERPIWKRMAGRIVHGPDDWRLAYVSFALTALMFLLLPAGGILLIVPAFIVSRAFIELMAERGEALGARRWLVLPPIFFVTLFLAGTAFIAPVVGIGAWGLEGHGFAMIWGERHLSNLTIAGSIAIGAGIWWILLAGLIVLLLQPIRTLLRPLADGLRRSHMIWLALLGVVALAAGGFLVY